MELRHFRCFAVLAEELHFARAAQRLNIEQSPLSRTIKELETELNVRLFERAPRGTRLTWAGEVFLENTRRIFVAVDQAKVNVQAAAAGFRGSLRIALSDGIVPRRLAALLTQSRLDDPDVEIRFFEVPLSQQIRGLRDDLYDAGFSRSDESDNGLQALPVWNDPIVVALPARHPLLAHRTLSLEMVLEYPLVLCHPEVCEGHYKQIERILRTVDREITVAEFVATHELMLTLVSAGYGLGLACQAQIAACHRSEIAVRHLAGVPPMLTTYLLRPQVEPFAEMERFIRRVVDTT